MTKLKIPKTGTRVRVTTDWKDVYRNHMPLYSDLYSTQVDEGTITPSDPEVDPPDSFNLLIQRSYHPVATIPFHRVLKIEVLEGTGEVQKVEPSPRREAQDVQVFQVQGSKGDTYTVTRNSNTWSCTCQGFGFRKICKHINDKKKELLGKE